MRLFKFRKQDSIDRRAAISGIPILNPSAKIEKGRDGSAMVKLTMKRGSGFFERIRPPVIERSYELDEFGVFVIGEVDGKRSVLDIINSFEKRFPMSRREAELSVVAFFKLLMERHVVSVAVQQSVSERPVTKGVSLLILLGLFCLTGQSASALDKKVVSPEAAKTFREISQLGTHGVIAPGTKGNLAMEKQVSELFSKSGFKNGEIKFEAPILEPGKLTLECGGNGSFILDAMHPSLMRPGNFKELNFHTNLVYIGKGDIKALETAKGINLDGALAVMDYNSYDRWVDLLRFGIKGVVFIGNGNYTHLQAVKKVNNSEVSFPRFFIDGKEGKKLLSLCQKQRSVKAEATATPSRWHNGILRDLWVMIPGSDKRMSEQVMVITASLDANCVVPGKATGAQRLVNIHILLKLLEDFRKVPPGYSVMLVGVNGHTNRYAGERLLSWHLLAEEIAIEDHRDKIAQEMRIARLFATEYKKLQLKPVDEKHKPDLHVMMEIMWLLNEKQDGEHKPETELNTTPDSEKSLLENAAIASEPLENAGEYPFNLDEFLDDQLQVALDQAQKKVMDGYSGFLANRGRKPSEVAAEKKEDLAIFESLAKLPIPELRKKLNSVRDVFEDEKLFESWRTKLDESTGRRTYIKSKLQDEFKATVNKISMEMMAISVSKDHTQEEKEAKIAELKQLKNNARKVLVLFNKMDIGVGRSRTYYRQIAVDDTQRNMLLDAKNKYVNKFGKWEGILQKTIDMDMENGAVRTALGARKVALVIPLELDALSNRFGFSYHGPDTMPDGFRNFGGVLSEIADSIPGQDSGNSYVDALSSGTEKTPEYFFHFPESSVVYFQDSQATPAVSLKSAFTSAGALFSPDDSLARIDADVVHNLQDRVRRFIIAISMHDDVLSPTVLKPVVKKRNYKNKSWSSRVRTYAMAEFTGKPIPTEEIPGTMVAIYRQNNAPDINPSLVDGDVVNAFRGITDITGNVSFYGLRERRRLSPLGYRMDDDFINVTYATDKGRIQSSKQINSNMQRAPRITLPMFKCQEFVIKDRRDTSLISAQSIEVFKYWPKIAQGRSDPVKFGVNGASCLSPARSHASWGPVGIYLEKPKLGRHQKSLMVITENKRCLLNASPGTKESQEGLGFESPKDMPADFFMQVSHDMQILNHFRDQEMKGVVNQLLKEFQAKGKKHNEMAGKERTANNHLEFLRENYQALGNEMKAYAEMQTMSGDMLQSIIVFMALMIPFCFFLQKLLFAFRKIEHELFGFSLMFLTTFVIFRLIHPAFRLAMNPEAIFIAFVLGAIGCFTTWVLYGRFHGEMQILMRGIGGIGESTSYGTVGQTATIIGVQNMRRRRVRTTLTTATIILVVFTMLAFSSVSRKAKPTLINKAEVSPYTGILYHWPAGLPMKKGIASVLETIMSKKGSFMVRRSAVHKDGWRMEKAADPKFHIDIKAISGLPKDDIVLRDSMALIVGDTFSSDNAHEVLLPVSAAEALGISDGDVGKVKVTIMGNELTVCGLLHDQRYRAARDLNPNLPLMPLGPSSTDKTEEEKEGSLEMQVVDIEKRLLDPDSVAVIPVGLAKELGAMPCAVSVIYPDSINEFELGEELNALLAATQAKYYVGSRNAFRISKEAAAPVDSGVYYVGNSYRTTIGGFAKLIIPLIIAGSIILNTMLGTVYERKSEIAVFNAIGLNPTHIFLFFLAEAMVYSFIGAVGGYLIGQVLTVSIKSMGLIQDMNINFSSLVVVYAILLTMLLVMLSTIYPGYVATRLAVPSGKRKWSMPDHDGNKMQVVFPCIYRPKLAFGIMHYLYSFFEPLSEQSSGDIIAEFKEAHEEKDEKGRPVLIMKYHLSLAPYDLGVTQHATFKATYDEIVKSYRLHMDVERDSGRDTNWITTNRPFLERMRKHLIRWRNIDPTRQHWHVQHSDQLFKIELDESEDDKQKKA